MAVRFRPRLRDKDIVVDKTGQGTYVAYLKGDRRSPRPTGRGPSLLRATADLFDVLAHWPKDDKKGGA